jgi:hypothetical protein
VENGITSLRLASALRRLPSGHSQEKATAEVFWTAFRGLPRQDQQAVLRRIVQSSRLRRDLMDLAVIEERRAEPARLLREYLRKTRSK